MATYHEEDVRRALESAYKVIGHLIVVLHDNDYDEWGGPDNEVDNWLDFIRDAESVIEYAGEMMGANV